MGKQAQLLSVCQLIAKELIEHHCVYHCKYINSHRPNLRTYCVGDMVYAKRAIKSNKKCSIIAKISESLTSPWCITTKLSVSPYAIMHRDTKKIGKLHAAHISPFPSKLLSFLPIDGPYNQYGQLHLPIGKNPYYNSGIKGFHPTDPFKTQDIAFASTVCTSNIHVPTLAELNLELFDWKEGEEE